MEKLDVMTTIKKGESAIKNRYELTPSSIHEINNNSSGTVELIANAFYFGYMQGIEAAKVKQRKDGIK